MHSLALRSVKVTRCAGMDVTRCESWKSPQKHAHDPNADLGALESGGEFTFTFRVASASSLLILFLLALYRDPSSTEISPPYSFSPCVLLHIAGEQASHNGTTQEVLSTRRARPGAPSERLQRKSLI